MVANLFSDHLADCYDNCFYDNCITEFTGKGHNRKGALRRHMHTQHYKIVRVCSNCHVSCASNCKSHSRECNGGQWIYYATESSESVFDDLMAIMKWYRVRMEMRLTDSCDSVSSEESNGERNSSSWTIKISKKKLG